MAVWSCLRGALGLGVNTFSRSAGKVLTPNATRSLTLSAVRRGGGDDHKFQIIPSKFQYEKFKDMLHYYFLVGLIPVGLVIFYCNVFIGPAQLTPIPEDYVPKHWEYSRHPITRFIVRYIHASPQQEYEKYCHFLFEESEKRKLRELESRIKNRMAKEGDYQAYYYQPVTGKYIRAYKQVGEKAMEVLGD